MKSEQIVNCEHWNQEPDKPRCSIGLYNGYPKILDCVKCKSRAAHHYPGNYPVLSANCKHWEPLDGREFGGKCKINAIKDPLYLQCLTMCNKKEEIVPLTLSVKQKPNVIIQEQPKPTINNVSTFVQATIFGEYVDNKEIVDERMQICSTCEYKRTTPEGKDWCGVCGCKVSATEREITNLAAYKENLPKWGCKHPRRRKRKWSGFGWKR